LLVAKLKQEGRQKVEEVLPSVSEVKLTPIEKQCFVVMRQLKLRTLPAAPERETKNKSSSKKK
jgi:hypothetical protein